MRITCPACQASYEISDHLLVHTPERVRCARCGAEWAWARAISSPEEDFELPDLFSDSPPRQAAREPVPDLSMLTDPDPPRESPKRDLQAPEPPLRGPIGSPIFDIGSELSFSPPEPLDRLVPPEPQAPPARPPDEPVLRETPPPEPPRQEPRKETPVDIPEVPFPKAPAAQNRRPPPLARAETSVEIPQVPFPKGQKAREQKVTEQKREPKISLPTVSNLAHERAMSREEAFRRVIETTRQRSQAAPPRRPSRRPQIVAILAVILLIAIIFGIHFALVYGLAGTAG